MNEFTRPSGGSSSFGDCQARDHGKRSVMPGGHNDRRRQARRWKRPHCFFFPPSDVTSVTPHASCISTSVLDNHHPHIWHSMEVGQRLFLPWGYGPTDNAHRSIPRNLRFSPIHARQGYPDEAPSEGTTCSTFCGKAPARTHGMCHRLPVVPFRIPSRALFD